MSGLNPESQHAPVTIDSAPDLLPCLARLAQLQHESVDRLAVQAAAAAAVTEYANDPKGQLKTVAAQLQVAAARWLPAPDAARMPALVHALHGERVGQWGVLRGQNATGHWISEWWDAASQRWQEAAEDSHDTEEGKDSIVLYLGDWDPNGLYMSEVDLPSRLQRYGSDWKFQRIAILEDDLEELPSFPTASKTGDKRFDWYTKHTTADPSKCWELDAMDPNDLRERVRSAIIKHIDAEEWDNSLKTETVEKEIMREFHRQWKDHFNRGR